MMGDPSGAWGRTGDVRSALPEPDPNRFSSVRRPSRALSSLRALKASGLLGARSKRSTRGRSQRPASMHSAAGSPGTSQSLDWRIGEPLVQVSLIDLRNNKFGPYEAFGKSAAPASLAGRHRTEPDARLAETLH